MSEEFKSYEDLECHVLEWARERAILEHSTALAQLKKTQEELDELKQALETDNIMGIIDGYGDVLVTLIIGADLKGLDLTECLAIAYEEIKDRKGQLNSEGIFVKE